MPFEYGADSSLAYVADGLSAGLVSRLANFRSLYVSPTVFVAQETAKAGRESVARRLGVNLLIQGKMHESGGTVKVLLSVYDVVHSRVLDSAELTGDHSQLVELEGQIYENVARQMQLQGSEGSFRAGMNPTARNQAYDRYLKARYVVKVLRVKGTTRRAELTQERRRTGARGSLAFSPESKSRLAPLETSRSLPPTALG